MSGALDTVVGIRLLKLLSTPIEKSKAFQLGIINKDGKTALYEAATRGDEDVVALLIAAGADLNVADKDGVTALLEAALTAPRETP